MADSVNGLDKQLYPYIQSPQQNTGVVGENNPIIFPENIEALDDNFPYEQEYLDAIQNAAEQNLTPEYSIEDFYTQLSQEQLSLLFDEYLTQANQYYIIETLSHQTQQSRESMDNYFDTLGWADVCYDGIKGFLDVGITRNEIKNLYANEVIRNEFLGCAYINNGEIVLTDDESVKEEGIISRSELDDFVANKINSYSTTEEIIEYSTNFLGYSEEEVIELIRTSLVELGLFYDDIKIIKNENNEYIVESTNSIIEPRNINDFNCIPSEILAQSLAENSKIHSQQTLSFEEIYQITTGAKYDFDKIQAALLLESDYQNIVQIQTSTLAQEEILKNATPQEAYKYFVLLSQQMGDESKASELFNSYYAQMFNYSIVDEKGDIIYPARTTRRNELTCIGISISQDGKYLYQQIDSSNLTEEIIQRNQLYQDEFGNYYQLVNLENETIVTNDGEYEDYYGTYNDALYFFENTNLNISNSHIYFEQAKELYNEINGEDAFDKIQADYIKAYKEAFGDNALINQLELYIKDMDSYSRNISKFFSIGFFALSFIPGVHIAPWMIALAAGSDNIIDFANIVSNNKDSEIGGWLLNTSLEAMMFMAGAEINIASNNLANRFTSNFISRGNPFVTSHAAGFEAACEYGIDNAISVAWDLSKCLFDGSLYQNGELNLETIKDVVIQNAIFNSADLKGGIAFYRNLNTGNAIDLGNGTKFSIDPKTGKISYGYSDGSMVVIKPDGSADFVYRNQQVALKHTEGTIWSTDSGFSIDLVPKNQGVYIPYTNYGLNFLSKTIDEKINEGYINFDNPELAKELLLEQYNPLRTMELLAQLQNSNTDIEPLVKLMEILKPSDVNTILYKLSILAPDEIKVIVEDLNTMENYFKDHEKEATAIAKTSFDDVDNITNIAGRAKSERSSLIKLIKGILSDKGINSLDEAYRTVKDAFGTRVQMRKLESSDVTKVVNDTLSQEGLSCTYKEFCDFMSGKKLRNAKLAAALESSKNDILVSLKRMQTQPVVDRLIQIIESQDSNFRIKELSNYGNDLSSYFTYDQIEHIAQAYFKKTGEKLDVITKLPKDRPKETRVGFSDETGSPKEQYMTVDEQKAQKPSGYATTQMDVEYLFYDKTTGLGELQIRGQLLNEFADVEHIPYDIRTGKITQEDIKYSSIYSLITNLSDESFAKYNEYLTKVYDCLRMQELGINVPMPKIGDGYVNKDGVPVDVSGITREGLMAFLH